MFSALNLYLDSIASILPPAAIYSLALFNWSAVILGFAACLILLIASVGLVPESASSVSSISNKLPKAYFLP